MTHLAVQLVHGVHNVTDTWSIIATMRSKEEQKRGEECGRGGNVLSGCHEGVSSVLVQRVCYERDL